MSNLNSVHPAVENTAEQLRNVASDVTAKVREAGAQAKQVAQDQYEAARDAAGEYYDQGMECAKQYSGRMEEFVRDEPMKALAIAIGAGFLVGFVLARR